MEAETAASSDKPALGRRRTRAGLAGGPSLPPLPKKRRTQGVQFGDLVSEVPFNAHDKRSFTNLSSDRRQFTGERGYCMLRAAAGVAEGTWYCEFLLPKDQPIGSAIRIGWSTEGADAALPVGADHHSWGIIGHSGSSVHRGVRAAYGRTFGGGDVVGVLLHIPAGQGGVVAAREGGLAEGLARRAGLQMDARHAAEVGVRLVHLRSRAGQGQGQGAGSDGDGANALPPAVVKAMEEQRIAREQREKEKEKQPVGRRGFIPHSSQAKGPALPRPPAVGAESWLFAHSSYGQGVRAWSAPPFLPRGQGTDLLPPAAVKMLRQMASQSSSTSASSSSSSSSGNGQQQRLQHKEEEEGKGKAGGSPVGAAHDGAEEHHHSTLSSSLSSAPSGQAPMVQSSSSPTASSSAAAASAELAPASAPAPAPASGDHALGVPPPPPSVAIVSRPELMVRALVAGQDERVPVVPGSFVRFFVNGVDQGVAFTDVTAGRAYYPTVSLYHGARARVQAGPKLYYPPESKGGQTWLRGRYFTLAHGVRMGRVSKGGLPGEMADREKWAELGNRGAAGLGAAARSKSKSKGKGKGKKGKGGTRNSASSSISSSSGGAASGGAARSRTKRRR